jgi:predicted ATP-binding protein involved in virulence
MKLKRLKMQSFRGIGDLTLEFSPNSPTIIMGVNGVGKSSILDCLAILFSTFVDLMRQDERSPETASSATAQVNGHIYIQNSSNVVISSSISEEQSNQISYSRLLVDEDISNFSSESINTVTIIFDSKEVSWKNSRDRINRLSNHLTEGNLMELVDALVENLYKHQKLNIPIVVYYSVNRSVKEIALNINHENSFDQLDAYDQALAAREVSFRLFFEWFRALEDLENEERRDNLDYRDRRLEAVRDAIKSIEPEFTNLRVRRSPLRMVVTKKKQELLINQLSDGEKCLIALVGDLARRLAIANPSLPNPLHGEGIVLIDEIELHLHPQWQRGIITKLTQTFPNCQFILTTHSPQVVADVKPENIYLLESSPDGITARHPDASFGLDSNRILEDLMGVPERPEQIRNELRRLFRLIDDGDLVAARQLQQQLESLIGEGEPDFAKADVLIRRKEILGK